MTFTLKIEADIVDIFLDGNDKEEMCRLLNQLLTDSNLFLYDNWTNDMFGKVTKISNIKITND